MQERLLDIGKWLNINSEAIYGSSCWEQTCQWSKGTISTELRGEYKVKYDVMKLTVSPDEGFARKEILFTQNEDKLYCICPVYPKGELVVKDVKVKAGSKITLLGLDKSLIWKQKGSDIIITVPALTASEVPCQYAWTFKMTLGK